MVQEKPLHGEVENWGFYLITKVNVGQGNSKTLFKKYVSCQCWSITFKESWSLTFDLQHLPVPRVRCVFWCLLPLLSCPPLERADVLGLRSHLWRLSIWLLPDPDLLLSFRETKQRVPRDAREAKVEGAVGGGMLTQSDFDSLWSLSQAAGCVWLMDGREWHAGNVRLAHCSPGYWLSPTGGQDRGGFCWDGRGHSERFGLPYETPRAHRGFCCFSPKWPGSIHIPGALAESNLLSGLWCEITTAVYPLRKKKYYFEWY